MMNDALPLQILYVGDSSMSGRLFQVGKLIDAVDKTEVNIIRLQGFQLPVDGTLNLVQIQCPAVFSTAVICAEMDLKVHLIPATGYCPAISRERRSVPGGHVKVINAVFQRHGNRLFGFPLARSAKGTVSHTNDTDLFISVG